MKQPIRRDRKALDDMVNDPKDNKLLHEMFLIADDIAELVKRLHKVKASLDALHEAREETTGSEDFGLAMQDNRPQEQIEEARVMLRNAWRRLYNAEDSAYNVLAQDSDTRWQAVWEPKH
jgi:hypothetical protein